jgi:hypothetical protein
MTEVSVKITGLRELTAAFKKLDAELPKELKGSFLVVARHVVGAAQQRMPFVSGRAAGSVKARASTRGASIAFGGTAAPYMPWLDFGGSVGRGHKPGVGGSGSIKRPWLGAPHSPAGRYVYPAIAEAKPETEAAVDAAVKHAAFSAGFDIEGTA